MQIYRSVLIAVTLLMTAGIFTASQAQQMVYEPKNPAFGGNPGNYSWLKNSAQTQNQHEEIRDGRLARDPLQDFQASLQRQVLSQLTRDIVRRQFDLEDGEMAEESRFEFGEFTIDLQPGVDGVTVLISNIMTGEETSITVPSF